MENKPVITCHGDQTLFASLHSNLQSLLPKDAVEWKRSYGRARTVIVEAVFVPFSPQIIPDENTSSSLIGQPCFHVFWTGCDSDQYKNGVKEEITNWISALKIRGVSDWLIVVVHTDDRKNKLLPRSSVIDKVKNDFCNKNSDRCIQLLEPLKAEMRSMESWHNLTVRLRQLILQSFTIHINKFEENMRAQRERRNEDGWRFSKYFMLQEELAFTFEMFGLYEESLVQYDELDALFTQFVVNHAAGETAQWLNSSFSHDVKRWSGLDLTQLMNQRLRQLIQDNHASLLDFRNYLFSRQCAMLFMLYRPWEVAQRSVSFMHNCIQELAILDLSLPPGAVSSWVFLSCLAVMDACERFADSSQVEKYSLYTASLWEYARTKLLDLGSLCGLMPDCTTTSQHLKLVVDILAGIDGGSKMDGAEIGPNERLSSALSSKEAFHKNYMELAELAMGTFKHIGRYRSARLIGKDLAEFYMRFGEYAKAEAFLSDAYKTYKMEGWEQLADHTRIDIALCQKLQGGDIRYVKSCCQLATSQSMNIDKKSEFCDELLRLSKETIEDFTPLRLLPVFTLKRVHLLENKVLLNSDIEFTIDLYNNTLRPLPAECIKICYRPWLESDGVVRSRGSSVTSHLSVESSLLQQQLTNITIDEPRNAEPTDTHSQVGVMYSEVGKFYSHSLPKEIVLHKEDYTLFVHWEDEVLNPGLNTVKLRGKASTAGVYVLNQLCVKMNKIEFLHNFSTERLKLSVLCDQPIIKLESSEKLYSGIPQVLSLWLNTGSYPVPAGAKLRISCLSDISIQNHGQYVEYTDAIDAYKTLEYNVNVSAPIDSKSVKSHKIYVECDWLEEKAEFDIEFHSIVNIKHRLLTANNNRKYVCLEVKNDTQSLTLELSNHELIIKEGEGINTNAKTMNPAEQKVKLCPEMKSSYVWQLENTTLDRSVLNCNFSVDYRIGDVSKSANYDFILPTCKTLYTVKSEVHSTAEIESQAGNSCRFVVEINRECDSNEKLIYKVNADEEVWSISGKTTGILSHEEKEISMDVIPLIGGYLPLPDVQLLRFENSKTDDGSGDADKISTVPFFRGEVYNASLASHVRVQPPPSSGAIQIKVRS